MIQVQDEQGDTFAILRQGERAVAAGKYMHFKNIEFAEAFVSWLTVDTTFWKAFIGDGISGDDQTIKSVVARLMVDGLIVAVKIDQ